MLNFGEEEESEQVRRGKVRKEEVSVFDLEKQSAVIAIVIVAAEAIFYSLERALTPTVVFQIVMK